MPLKKGHPRDQTLSMVMEDFIGPDHPVRVIDAFVEALDLPSLGFRPVGSSFTGSPAYGSAMLLKIYLYGYLNRVRSSRRLEAECGRNLEMYWLTGAQKPCYHTISTFRTLKIKGKDGHPEINHRKALEVVFRTFSRFIQGLGLYGKEVIAVDGTKIHAQNSKKNNITEEKIARKCRNIDEQFESYLEELDLADATEAAGQEVEISYDSIFLALGDLINRKVKLTILADALQAAQAQDPMIGQISLTDPDARALAVNNEGHTEIGYNVQSVVDGAHYLVAYYEVTNTKDEAHLAPVSKAAKSALGLEQEEEISVLADKGYHSGAGIHQCAEAHITTYVAVPKYSQPGKVRGFRKEDFVFDKKQGVYICPAGKVLKSNGTWYQKRGRKGQLQAQFQRFRLSFSACNTCAFRDKCLSDNDKYYRHGRHIERSVYDEAVQENKKRVFKNRALYKRRQAMVEHPFGTIKRSWGMYYTLLKGKEKVSGEYAIVFTCYNLRRLMTVLGINDLLLKIKKAFIDFWMLWCFRAPVATGAAQDFIQPLSWRNNKNPIFLEMRN